MTVREELEVLTGKLIRGDITPIVYDILKSSGKKFDENTIMNILRKELPNVNDRTANTQSVLFSESKRVVDFSTYLSGKRKTKHKL